MTNDVTFRSDIPVTLIESSLSDDMVVKAARVSTKGAASKEAQADEGLINYLMRDRHGSPFEHGSATFLVTAPIFVWREHMRHRHMSYNEESGRYKQLSPEFYIPSDDRNLLQVGKPGHYEFVPAEKFQIEEARRGIQTSNRLAYATYEQMLVRGIAREVARMVLPVNIYSSAYVTMNPRALMHFLSLRTKSDAATFKSFPMREIEMVAEQYEDFFRTHMPLTYIAFVRNGRVAP